MKLNVVHKRNDKTKFAAEMYMLGCTDMHMWSNQNKKLAISMRENSTRGFNRIELISNDLGNVQQHQKWSL